MQQPFADFTIFRAAPSAAGSAPEMPPPGLPRWTTPRPAPGGQCAARAENPRSGAVHRPCCCISARAVNAGCGQDAVVVLLQVPGHRFTAGPGHAHGVEEQNGRALPVAPCRKLHGISPRWLAYANFKSIIVPMLPAVKGLSSAILPGRPRAKARSPAAAGGQNNCCCPARRPGRSP